MPRRSGASPRFLATLYELQGGICPICGAPMIDGQTTIDHVRPKRGKRARHGLYQNALATHWRCNNQKGDREPTGCELIWLAAVNARLAVEPWRMPLSPDTPTLAAVWPRDR
jgi:5-methylcytosine-specific restriction endonuclease McrA